MQEFIKQLALSVGFDACGIAEATELTDDAAFMRSWLEDGLHGDMQYLVNNFEKRIDPRVLVPGCKSVVVTLLNYHPAKTQASGLPKIAKYAYSATDYHYVVREKLRRMEEKIIEKYGEASVNNDYQHVFADSAPVLEKRWAEKAGLGWIGRNTLLINRQFGSNVFIGILLLNLEVGAKGKSVPFSCGNCTKCVDACPTQALNGRSIDARKCISYLTLERRSPMPEAYKDKLNGWIVGCDICSDVCPWNVRFAHPHNHPELEPTPAIFSLTHKDWEQMSKSEFKKTFKSSAVLRKVLD